ncbi:MAG: hypothetical protein M1823_003172 [Watsoniomyces obsoletus]|nr:MAG: hypothetical protein M1823_003172 [Watsoniomyces obsoletus]
MFENAATTFASLAILGLAGYSYHRYYKRLVLMKIEGAFKPGDPVLELAGASHKEQHGVSEEEEHNNSLYSRDEQDIVNAIVSGEKLGHYYLIIGEKGSGKTNLLVRGMHRVAGEGISMLEAHGDLEIFRIRLGKALDFEYHEDYIGSLFSIRGPRDTTPLLDIERAFNKLEKVALRRRETIGRPLVLIVNSCHLLRDNEDDQDLLELIQQRAEQWAASKLVTVILNSDDYWVYERLKLNASRMEVIPVTDLPKDRAIAALRGYRRTLYGEEPTRQELEDVYDRVGGRLAFLHRAANAADMRRECEHICETEKTWFLSQCTILGMEADDDTLDQQKYASTAMVLAKALVDKQQEMDRTYDPERGHILPEIPLHEARQIMTRVDFIQKHDHVNIFTIDSRAMVRADSVPMQRAFQEICAQPGFDAHLEGTLQRIGDIESLGRTRELVAKDLWNQGKYKFTTMPAGGRGSGGTSTTVEVVPGETES